MSFHFSHDKIHPGLLTVIGVISNPMGYKTRYQHFRKWKEKIEAQGVRVLAVELAYGAHPFEVTSADNPWDVQLRLPFPTYTWVKESMINIGIRHLTKMDPSWRYVGWEDCDTQHLDDDWATKAIRALQHHAVIQTWTNGINLDAKGNVIRLDYSFCSSYLLGRRRGNPDAKEYDPYWHSGYGWAARRESIESLGGLISESLIGAADHQMAHALVGNVHKSYHGQVTDGYKRVFDLWQARAEKYIKRNIGAIDGTVVHWFHGSRRNRRYVERWEIVLKSEFDPARDLTMDSQGLHVLNELSPNFPYLRNSLLSYHGYRDEDCTFNHNENDDIICRLPPPPVESPFAATGSAQVSWAQTTADGKRVK